MDKIYYKSINEIVYHGVTRSGLDVHIIKKEGFNNKCAYFATKFGSFNTGDILLKDNNETKIIGGLAHFLEHRVFDYKKGNVIDLYYKLGADVNAYTSYDRTVYYFSTINNFKECLELLLDFPTSFTMTKEAVENEKDIIVSELLMYKDDPNDKLYRALMNSLYKEHPVRFDVGGEPNEVRETTIELLSQVHSTFYNPKNMHLVIVGDVDVEDTFNLIDSKEFNENRSLYTKNKLNEDLDVVSENVVVKADVNNKRLLIGYKLAPIDKLKELEKTRLFLSFDLLVSILFSSSSDFYKMMIDEKYVTSLAIDIMQYDDLFCLLIEADILVDEKIVFEKIDERLKSANKVINEEKLSSIKKKEIASIIKGSDSCNALAKNYLTYILDNMNYCEMIDMIKSVNVADLKNVIKYYKNAKHSYALLTGEKND